MDILEIKTIEISLKDIQAASHLAESSVIVIMMKDKGMKTKREELITAAVLNRGVKLDDRLNQSVKNAARKLMTS